MQSSRRCNHIDGFPIQLIFRARFRQMPRKDSREILHALHMVPRLQIAELHHITHGFQNTFIHTPQLQRLFFKHAGLQLYQFFQMALRVILPAILIIRARNYARIIHASPTLFPIAENARILGILTSFRTLLPRKT